MKLQKAIFHTFLFILFLELIGIWILLIPDEMESASLIKASHFINSIITLFFLVLIFISLKQSDLLKYNKPEPKYYFIALVSGIGFVFFQSILNIIYYQELLFNYNFTLERLTSLSIIASIIFVPLTEELFFRNYLLRRLLEKYKPIKAIFISSLLFAFIHIPFVSLFFEFMDFSFHHAFIALFGGLIAGILFYKSKSIIPPIIFHVFWNLTSYIT
ncbi:CPBP family intramembrane glutamic endopeptidase [Winogradskyella flava]|uniref:CPBP family intramembrane metalloprotease n=1 Tax=Winogradskyella flava TaxID=1884876 RepID=A0A842IVH2_9FLAO|nr:type II CAAX endopeptidase family protein [Winogradskyella flava]MBC2845723.1 CPBP family intramembrane metalloprotease [Winogradskyella flava]